MLTILNDLAFFILGSSLGMLTLSMMVVDSNADEQQFVQKEKSLPSAVGERKNASKNIHEIVSK